jgi:hypothetical protein
MLQYLNFMFLSRLITLINHGKVLCLCKGELRSIFIIFVDQGKTSRLCQGDEVELYPLFSVFHWIVHKYSTSYISLDTIPECNFLQPLFSYYRNKCNMIHAVIKMSEAGGLCIGNCRN